MATTEIQALSEPGSRVLQIACGPDSIFCCSEVVGPEGKIIAVDLSPVMVAKAKARFRRLSWNNIDLVVDW